jgi:hypothetical protein
VAGLTAANGVDNVTVYVLLFAGQSPGSELLTIGTFFVLLNRVVRGRRPDGAAARRWPPWSQQLGPLGVTRRCSARLRHWS